MCIWKRLIQDKTSVNVILWLKTKRARKGSIQSKKGFVYVFIYFPQLVCKFQEDKNLYLSSSYILGL